ncbi:putative Ubiquitin-like domain-containing protein [Helianthus annuus]|nr:putative Ubiquitin-like domain-containing protein [Helianthus annuus]
MASLRKPNGDGVDYFEAEENDYGVINVITATGKTISLQVKGLDTISSIKLKIESQEDIPCRQQKLIFDEKLLQDNDILGNLCIEKESILKLLHCQDPLQCASLKNQTAKMADKGKLGMADGDDRSRKVEEKASSHNVAFNINYIYLLHQRHGMINIKTDTGKILLLGVKGSETVGSVKLKIQAKEHIPFDQQELIFNEVVLENQYTLSSYSMKNQSTLTVTGKSVEMMKIKVKISTGKKISLTVYPTDTIADVKKKIYDTEGIPCGKQALIIDEKVLGDSGTLFDYYITTGGETVILMRQSRGFVIDILMPYDGETVILKVKPSDTIRDVKAKLKGKTGDSYDKYELIFNEVVLHNDDMLVDCHINKESALTLMRYSTGFWHIPIRTPSGMEFDLEVKRTHTIRSVKEKIEAKLGIPRSNQRLIFSEKHLEDNNTLDDCDIYEDQEEVVYLEFVD